MKIVDANVLLHAVNTASSRHEASRRWLDEAVEGGDDVGFDWTVGVAFLRLSTSPLVFPRPLPVADAVDQLGAWVDGPGARWVHGAAGHLARLGELLRHLDVAGNLVNDAHLAALALEHRATVVTYDRDLARFPGVASTSPDRLLDARR